MRPSLLSDSYGDPEFEWHATMARTLGLLALRLADSHVLPMDYTEYAEQMDLYVDEVCTPNAYIAHLVLSLK